jgi:capsular polysaccharide biosynthesis protein
MATRTEPPRTRRELPELEEEREVDLGRYWSTIASHWWLPAVGLAIGIAIGFLISIGGKQVYQAKATVYLGQPLSQSGVQVQSQATNPSTVRQIVTAPATIDAVARKVGLRPNQLRGHVSTQAISGNITRLGQNPLVSITVTGHFRGKIARAANALASSVVNSPALAGYAKTKIANLQKLVNDEEGNLANIDESTKTLQAALRQSSGLSTTERLILLGQLNGLLQQRLTIVDQLTTNQQQLALARDVEKPQINHFAAATKTTARSRRNTIIVAALIGLILGLVAALLWEPVVRVVRRPA